MKMKRIILIACLFIFLVNANAQEFEFGPKVGINTGKGTISELNTMSADVQSINSFNGGIYARLKVKVIGLYLQPEVIYTTRGGVYSFVDGTTKFDVTSKAHYIDVPVLIGLKFVKLFRVYGGPNFQFLISQEKEIPPGITSFSSKDLNKNNTGLQFGVGLDVWKLRLDLKYDMNPASLGSFMDYKGVSPTVKNNMIIIQLGFKLWGVL